MHNRRQSTRNRLLTTKALEVLEWLQGLHRITHEEFVGGLLLVPFLEMVLINPTWRRVRMVCTLPSNKMKGTLGKHFQVQFHHHQSSSATSSSIFAHNLLDFGCRDDPSTSVPDLDAAIDKDFIFSQDFFRTPDYITPDHQNLMNDFDCNKMAKALQFIHERRIVHLDVKPDNAYVKNGVYKLGDFGCVTLLNKSLPVEEGDAHYMPREILMRAMIILTRLISSL